MTYEEIKREDPQAQKNIEEVLSKYSIPTEEWELLVADIYNNLY